MTRKEKTEYLRISLLLQGIKINNEMSDRIIEIYTKVLELKGKFTIQDEIERETQKLAIQMLKESKGTEDIEN